MKVFPRPIPLECSDRSENATNRKICFFCIKTVNNFFFNSKKYLFFFDQKFLILKFSKCCFFLQDLPKDLPKDLNEKVTILRKFQNQKLLIEKKYFFWSWKKIVNSFDAEKADLSIGGIFRAIRALQRDRPGKNCQNLWILPSIHVYTIASSYRVSGGMI